MKIEHRLKDIENIAKFQQQRLKNKEFNQKVVLTLACEIMLNHIGEILEENEKI